MTNGFALKSTAAFLVCVLSACGGGGGTHVNPIPSPTPSPTPNPTPTPTPTPPPTDGVPAIFPSVATSTDFATIGYEGPIHGASAGSLTANGFSVSYDAASKNYVMDVPASQPGDFKYYQQGDRYWNGKLTNGTASSFQPINVDVFRPGSQNWDFALTYTSFGVYNYDNARVGAFAFGQATPLSAVPMTGSASYDAFVAAQADVDYGIRGSATLQFNFGAGTLSGHFDPVIYDLLSGNTPLGHYSFVNSVYSTGSTTFSGQLSSSSVSGLGAFDGKFTGPAAQELMARFHAPFIDPESNTQKEMFGVWVGKH